MRRRHRDADGRGQRARYLVELVELSTLGLNVPDVHVNVADLGYGLDGLIGINFLRNYNIELRYAERRIVVEPIAP